MDREIRFARTLEEVRQKAKIQNNCISQAEVEEAFAPLALSAEQMDMVYQYLRQKKIGIGEPVDYEEYLLDEEKDYLASYLESLKAFAEVSEGEREAVTLSAMAGDGEGVRRLTEIFLSEVVEIAKLYAGQGVYLEDLIGEGNAALSLGVTMLGALEHASEAQGMLARLIMDAMEEYIADYAEESRKDQSIAEKVNKVADAANALYEELRRKVTVEELMAESGLSRKAIEDAIRMSGDKIEAIAIGVTS